LHVPFANASRATVNALTLSSARVAARSLFLKPRHIILEPGREKCYPSSYKSFASLTLAIPHGLGAFELDTEAEKAEALAQAFGDSLPPAERLAFLKELAEVLEVSFDEIERQRLFSVMNEQELRCLAEAGIDIQLHSHRHQWPLYDREMIKSEIVENRRFLARIVSHPLEHFCYPSGVYGLHQGEWLAALGVNSATTLEPGLSYTDTSPYALRRLVDGGPVSDIEFAAEMTGFMEIVRWIRQGQLISMLRQQFAAGRRSPPREPRSVEG
jgi:Polysaccharide deacetylase